MYRTIREASHEPKLRAPPALPGGDASEVDPALLRVRLLCSHFVKTAKPRLARLLLLAARPSSPLMPPAARLFVHRFRERLW